MATVKAGKTLQAFLDLIAISEGTSTSPITRADGYDIIVNGIDGPMKFADYSHHPFSLGRAPICVRMSPTPLYSTASGRYQLILPTWQEISGKYKIGTFSPANQDLAALHLLDECRAAEHIVLLEIPAAIEAAAETWASFPGNLYNQGGNSLNWLLATYQTCLSAQSV